VKMLVVGGVGVADDIVRNLSVTISFILSRNKKVEQHKKTNTHKIIV